MNPLLWATLGLQAVNSIFGMTQADRQAKQDWAIAKANLDYQTWAMDQQKAMFQQSMRHQTQMQDVQNAFNEEQTWKMFNAQNEYNSPQQQLNRAISAGLNPMTVAGANPVSASTSPAGAGSGGSAPSVPTLTAPHMDSPQLAGVRQFEILNGSAQRVKDIANAAQALSTSRRTDKLADAELQSILFQNSKIAEEQRSLEISNNIQKLLGVPAKKSEVLLNIASFGEKLAHIDTLISQGEYFQAEEYYTKVKSAGEEVGNLLKGKQLKWYDQLTQKIYEKYDSEIGELKARSYQEWKQGQLNNQLNSYYNLLGKGQQLANRLLEYDVSKREQTFQTEIEQFFDEAESTFWGSQKDMEDFKFYREKAIQAAKETDKWEINFWFGKAMEVLDRGTNIVNTGIRAYGAIMSGGLSESLGRYYDRGNLGSYDKVETYTDPVTGRKTTTTKHSNGHYENGRFILSK